MFFINSIDGVCEAKEKLQSVFIKKYPDKNNQIKFFVSIDPENGGYTILVSIKNKSLVPRFPETVNGYRVVIDGITKFSIPPSMDYT